MSLEQPRCCESEANLSWKAVAREARAAGAKVSPATMGRAEQIATRPDLEEKVVSGEMNRGNLGSSLFDE